MYQCNKKPIAKITNGSNQKQVTRVRQDLLEQTIDVIPKGKAHQTEQ
jgi:hypothetical protein